VASLSDTTDVRAARLREILTGLDSVLVGFSGGVDSTLLAAAALEALGAQRVLALTVASVLHPPGHAEETARVARELGLRHEVLRVDALANAGLARNGADRCYHCKLGVFRLLCERAAEEGLAHVCDGTNVDDQGDFRPGQRAVDELGVRQPLREAGLSKAEIRALSRAMALPTADKPSAACLASRIPYGTPLTEADLARVGRAEEGLRSLGFGDLRVRLVTDATARVELPVAELPRVLDPGTREGILAAVRAAGFAHVTLDLAGLRSGSQNETLGERERLNALRGD
jgi:pyridinium-3,5-biscarboxylic acid mononucleotide sulfurtransferase